MNCGFAHIFSRNITYHSFFYYIILIERKTNRADIDRLRPRIFVLTLIGVTLIFVVVLNIRWSNPIADLIEDNIDNVSVDMDLLPSLAPPDNVIATLNNEPKSTDRINKVDVTEQQMLQEELRETISFKPSEVGDAEQMKASEAEPIAPAITSMNGDELPMRIVEELPEFPGGMSQFVQWLNTALRYPANARTRKMEGTVLVSFIVEKDGTITGHKLVQHASSVFNQEAMRVIKLMPKWKPGTNHGKPVRTVVAVPIVFAL